MLRFVRIDEILTGNITADCDSRDAEHISKIKPGVPQAGIEPKTLQRWCNTMATELRRLSAITVDRLFEYLRVVTALTAA